MKRTTVAAAAAILLASTAAGSAADLAVKAPYAAPAPLFTWTGFYIGGHVGAGWGTTETSLDSASATGLGTLPVGLAVAQNSRSGFLGGGQIGYNFQSGWAVFGVQADIAGMDIKGTTPCILVFSCTAKSDWLATVSGRIGGVVADRTLVYVKGGAAWLNTKQSLTAPTILTALLPAGTGLGAGVNSENTSLGWLLGFGAEYAITQNWSAFIEYNYMDFDRKDIAYNLVATVPGGPAATANFDTSVKNKLSIAKIGVNYKF